PRAARRPPAPRPHPPPRGAPRPCARGPGDSRARCTTAARGAEEGAGASRRAVAPFDLGEEAPRLGHALTIVFGEEGFEDRPRLLGPTGTKLRVRQSERRLDVVANARIVREQVAVPTGRSLPLAALFVEARHREFVAGEDVQHLAPDGA